MPVTLTALSVKQPYANQIRDGIKTIETRTWATPHRGPLVIVSSKRPAIDPAGCAIAIVELSDCRPMTAADWIAACCAPAPDRWGWHLTNIRALITPIPVTGRLGLFSITLPRMPRCRKPSV